MSDTPPPAAFHTYPLGGSRAAGPLFPARRSPVAFTALARDQKYRVMDRLITLHVRREPLSGETGALRLDLARRRLGLYVAGYRAPLRRAGR